MFRTITIWALCITVVGLAIHWLVFARRAGRAGGAVRNVRRYSPWERLVHLVATVSFLVQAGTGFWACVCTGEQMTGYILMIHVTFGGLFAVCMVLAIITWAEDHRFVACDAKWLRHWGSYLTGRGGQPAGRFDAGEKMFFWKLAVVGTVVVVSPALSMLDLFGTAAQELLYEVHRYAALVLTIVMIKHAYLTTLARPGTYGSMISGNVSPDWANRYHPNWRRPTDGEHDET